MARCARETCRRWRPEFLVRRGTGITIEDGWYCSRDCLHLTIQARLERLGRNAGRDKQRASGVKLGALLLAGESKLPLALLARALEGQRTSGRRLGAELLNMGAVAAIDVQRALAKQANTKYLTAIDPIIARPGHGGLSREMVRALGLVPFASEEQTRILKVAYVAPLSRVALAALRELTGWTPDPYLVSDQAWPALVNEYGASRGESGTTMAATETVDEGVSRVALAAERGQPAKISQARLGSKVWVRVETADRVEDVLMAVDSDEDTGWQTAPTLH